MRNKNYSPCEEAEGQRGNPLALKTERSRPLPAFRVVGDADPYGGGNKPPTLLVIPTERKRVERISFRVVGDADPYGGGKKPLRNEKIPCTDVQGIFS